MSRCECGGGWIDGASVHSNDCPHANKAWSPAEIKEREIADKTKAYIDGCGTGLDMAISLMRRGSLRLAPLPFEVGKHPYAGRFHLWKALWCVWKEYRREHLHN